MALIDDYFKTHNISFDKEIEDLMLLLSPVYMKPAVMKEEVYLIPKRQDTYDYCEIPFANRIVTNIYDAVPLKSHFADFHSRIHATNYDDIRQVEGDFCFGWHGRHMMVNNLEDDRFIRIKFSEVRRDADNVYEDIYRGLKHCYYYSMIEDWNNLYESIKNLSEIKKNMLAKNVHTEKSRRTRQIADIKLFRI